jgi:hypothetical protein
MKMARLLRSRVFVKTRIRNFSLAPDTQDCILGDYHPELSKILLLHHLPGATDLPENRNKAQIRLDYLSRLLFSLRDQWKPGMGLSKQCSLSPYPILMTVDGGRRRWQRESGCFHWSFCCSDPRSQKQDLGHPICLRERVGWRRLEMPKGIGVGNLGTLSGRDGHRDRSRGICSSTQPPPEAKESLTLAAG